MSSIIGRGHPSNLPKQARLPSTPLYTLFSPEQIHQFQEAFNLIDANRDGRISSTDLSQTLSNLGQSTSDIHLASFLSDNPKGINFTQFLTMMGEHLLRLDKEDVLEEAFGCFDETDQGLVDVKELRDLLATTGDKMTEEEIDSLFSSRFTDNRKNTFNYREFTKSLKVNDPETIPSP